MFKRSGAFSRLFDFNWVSNKSRLSGLTHATLTEDMCKSIANYVITSTAPPAMTMIMTLVLECSIDLGGLPQVAACCNNYRSKVLVSSDDLFRPRTLLPI